MSTDVDRAAEFYARVLGWTLRDLDDPAISYRTFETGGRMAGGLGHAVDAPGDGAHQSRWWVYFKVDDVDATTADVPRHGGDVVREPFDSTFGRIAVLAGPSGERFCVLADNR